MNITPELLERLRAAIAEAGNGLEVGEPCIDWPICLKGRGDCAGWASIPLAFFLSTHFDEEALLDVARHNGVAHAECLRRMVAEGDA